ncbi:hypothetical protein LI90_1412 [Carbonactinospora thermoautotrophica]|uniref:Uncharacterized protein n=1 Tax=Carbonactinospora thermoautotrophica TaxID=1469144 RepID=A0A132MPQ7_9ACTN|nr:hypothetical protein [Carbonactinospora thermoautotrophica]KWW99773.1 hypothetical protein LI90_1412 [Carbonactinospora thermoautotrophica]
MRNRGAGLAELEAHLGGEVEITTFGLVSESVARGLGGHALTLATRLAWSLDPAVAVHGSTPPASITRTPCRTTRAAGFRSASKWISAMHPSSARSDA